MGGGAGVEGGGGAVCALGEVDGAVWSGGGAGGLLACAGCDGEGVALVLDGCCVFVLLQLLTKSSADRLAPARIAGIRGKFIPRHDAVSPPPVA